MVTFPHGQSVTVVRMGERNRDGDRLPSREFTVPGCAIAPQGGDTGVSGIGRSGDVSASMRLYAPPGSDIRAGDRVLVGTVEYRVEGAVRQWTFVFFGGGAGIVADLVEVTSSGSVQTKRP